MCKLKLKEIIWLFFLSSLVFLIIYQPEIARLSDEIHLVESTTQSVFQSNTVRRIHSGAYTEHPRIEIDDESDFITLGIVGDGSVTTPYLIEDLNITQSDGANCLSIRHIHAYVTIQNNFFDGTTNSQIAVYLENVTNVKILNNQVIDGIKGIYFIESQDCEILTNSIEGFTDGGIIIENCTSCDIEGNLVENSEGGAIKVLNSPNHNNIVENMVIGDDYEEYNGPGIYASVSNVTIKENSVLYHQNGIYLPSCNGSSIELNFINNSDWGIRVTGNENSIQNNLIERFFTGLEIVGNNNEIESNRFLYGQNGIDHRGNSSSYTYNVIYNCTTLGVQIRHPSQNNLLKWNDFVWNGLMIDSQAYIQEGSKSNTFNMNYWEDFTYPDVDDDGTVDKPYLIPVGLPFMGETSPENVTDNSPLTNAYNSPTDDLHYFNRPRIISLSTSPLETDQIDLTKTITLKWAPITYSTSEHSITYSAYYSSSVEGLDIWVPIAENTSENSINWNTRELASSGGMCCFSLKVVGTCSQGLSIEYVTASLYGVTNTPASWDLSIFLLTLGALALFIRRKKR